MRKAKSINELLGEAKVQESKGIEIDYRYSKRNGRVGGITIKPSEFCNIIHLGYCNYDQTDFFLCTNGDGNVYIYSGKLNDGTY